MTDCMDMVQDQNGSQLLRILVVDDTDSMRILVKEFFRRNKDVLIGEAEDEEGAFLQMKEFSPDVVLMDISLAGISGVDVTRQIKSSFPGVRVYLFSAYNADEYNNIKMESVCDGFIQKTNLKSELQQMIKTELGHKNNVPDNG